MNNTAPPTETTSTLQRGVTHDYSTSRIGVVPLHQRRSRYHFLSLWITLAAGFTYL